MPRAATCRQDAPLVQFRGDAPNTGDPLGAQVIHDGPQVLGMLLCVDPDRCYRLLVADLLAPERPCAIGVAELDATRFRGARAALVRSLINPASNSATEAIWVSRKRPTRHEGAQQRPSFANTTAAPTAFAWARTFASLGR